VTNLLCERSIVAKFKEVRTGWSKSRQIWQNLLSQKGCFAATDDDDDDDDDDQNCYWGTSDRVIFG
jgi:hypothetical protein